MICFVTYHLGTQPYFVNPISHQTYIMLRAIVDFNNLTPDGEQVVVATDRDIDRDVASKLSEGDRIILVEVNDFEVEAIIHSVQIPSGKTWWYGTPDWSTRKDLR